MGQETDEHESEIGGQRKPCIQHLREEKNRPSPKYEKDQGKQ